MATHEERVHKFCKQVARDEVDFGPVSGLVLGALECTAHAGQLGRVKECTGRGRRAATHLRSRSRGERRLAVLAAAVLEVLVDLPHDVDEHVGSDAEGGSVVAAVVGEVRGGILERREELLDEVVGDAVDGGVALLDERVDERVQARVQRESVRGITVLVRRERDEPGRAAVRGVSVVSESGWQ